jgi:hypothetical protein
VTLVRLLALALSIVLCAACDDTPTAPTSTTSSTASTSTTTSTSTPAAENFELLIPPQSDRFYSFSPTQAGDVKIGLMSVTLVPSPAAFVVAMRVGVGVPAGEGCAVSNAVDMVPALMPQLTVSVSTGVHCIDVADPGTLPGAALVSVRYTHP